MISKPDNLCVTPVCPVPPTIAIVFILNLGLMCPVSGEMCYFGAVYTLKVELGVDHSVPPSSLQYNIYLLPREISTFRLLIDDLVDNTSYIIVNQYC